MLGFNCCSEGKKDKGLYLGIGVLDGGDGMEGPAHFPNVMRMRRGINSC